MRARPSSPEPADAGNVAAQPASSRIEGSDLEERIAELGAEQEKSSVPADESGDPPGLRRKCQLAGVARGEKTRKYW